jgi:pyruvate/2-oxoglutarate dehydrogenase complex dihydrolipoamide acyltransferase (E2) component
MSRGLNAMAKDARGPQVLYIAASNDTQVSLATSRGSLGTLAWAQCIAAGQADTDRSGRINGEELRACSQAFIDRLGKKQNITLQGNTALPLSFVQTAAAAPAPTPAPTPAPAPAPSPSPSPAPAAEPAPPAPSPTASVNAITALRDLAAAADRSLKVDLTLARNSLRIGKDFLDFSVTTGKDGYLYILQVGSDGKTFNLLFPNKIDTDNAVAAGTHRFPRASWRVRAAGPTGYSHLLAIVSPVKKDLSRDMDASSVFPSSGANQRNTRTLVVEATGGGEGGVGRYGASDVVSLRETTE